MAANVPKFGNWEEDTLPYTAHFENARKGKANGRRMNPNDPEDNPEIFKALADHPMQHRGGQCADLCYRKGSKGSYNSFSSSMSSGRSKPQTEKNPNSNNLPKHHRAASIPKFGAWDATDPTSGEGFTVIFNKVKQEKHVRTINFPTLTQPPSKNKNSDKKLKCRSRLASKIHKFLRINCCFFR